MAKRAVIFLTASTIFSVILLPLSTDSAPMLPCLEGPHVIVLNETSARCFRCTSCPHNQGMSVNCTAGQNVSSTTLIACLECVAGVNFSDRHDTSQCTPCPEKDCPEETQGKCEIGGDHRICVSCEKGQYYNRTTKKCEHCSCQNTTQDQKEMCTRKGFKFFTDCPEANSTPPGLITVEESKNGLDTKTILMIVFLVIFPVVGCIYFILVFRRFRKIKLPDRRSNQQRSNQHCSRQNSCPDTPDEVQDGCARTSQSDPIPELDHHERTLLIEQNQNECLKAELTVLTLNAETSDKLYNKLNMESGLGNAYVTLAGRLGYTTEQVRQFETKGNPSRNVLECWSRVKGNNILKLQEILKTMNRDDCVTLLEQDLAHIKCQCVKCRNSVQKC